VRRLTKEERKRWGYADVWEIAPVRAAKSYPTMVPVELPWRCIKMHSDRNGIVVDPFAGAGTTIIAAEQTERRCYAMESDLIHCDLVVKRWEDFTRRAGGQNGESDMKMNIQTIPSEKLRAAAYNPRKDLKPGDAEYEKLRRSIEEFGYVEPVIWNERHGNIVGGPPAV
jgi:hypothetical protein